MPTPSQTQTGYSLTGMKPWGSLLNTAPASTTASTNASTSNSNGAALISLMAGLSGAYGSYAEAQSLKVQRGLQNDINNYNQFLFERQATDAIKRGEFAVGVSRRATKQLVGAQKAAQAAQGIRTDKGTALDIRQETQDIGELDALMIRNNAAREAMGFASQGVSSQMQSKAAIFETKMAEREAKLRGADTLLTGSQRAYMQYHGKG